MACFLLSNGMRFVSESPFQMFGHQSEVCEESHWHLSLDAHELRNKERGKKKNVSVKKETKMKRVVQGCAYFCAERSKNRQIVHFV